MTNPNDTLNTLWEMSERGTKEWWPERVRYGDYTVFTESVFFDFCGWHYVGECESEGSTIDLDDQHTLDLVAASCERWLVGKGLTTLRQSSDYQLYYTSGYQFYTAPFFTRSLPEAIEYAAKQQT